MLEVQAAEGATTGMREAAVLARVGPAAHFPDHPLGLVRAALRRITPTVTLHERFTALPPFA